MKSTMAFLLSLLVVFFVTPTSAVWRGHVINKCPFPLWAKTTNQLVGQETDSSMVMVSAYGGTYDAAYLPTWGISPGPDSKGVTIKLQTVEDPSFTTGHVYQIEYAHYQFKEIINKLSVDLSVVDGNSLADVARYVAVTTNGDIIDPHLCPKDPKLGGDMSTLYCATHEDPCDWEWQKGHSWKLGGMPGGLPKCEPNNDEPHCSHPIECDAGPDGTVLFIAC